MIKVQLLKVLFVGSLVLNVITRFNIPNVGIRDFSNYRADESNKITISSNYILDNGEETEEVNKVEVIRYHIKDINNYEMKFSPINKVVRHGEEVSGAQEYIGISDKIVKYLIELRLILDSDGEIYLEGNKIGIGKCTGYISNNNNNIVNMLNMTDIGVMDNSNNYPVHINMSKNLLGVKKVGIDYTQFCDLTEKYIFTYNIINGIENGKTATGSEAEKNISEIKNISIRIEE